MTKWGARLGALIVAISAIAGCADDGDAARSSASGISIGQKRQLYNFTIATPSRPRWCEETDCLHEMTVTVRSGSGRELHRETVSRHTSDPSLVVIRYEDYLWLTDGEPRSVEVTIDHDGREVLSGAVDVDRSRVREHKEYDSFELWTVRLRAGERVERDG